MRPLLASSVLPHLLQLRRGRQMRLASPGGARCHHARWILCTLILLHCTPLTAAASADKLPLRIIGSGGQHDHQRRLDAVPPSPPIAPNENNQTNCTLNLCNPPPPSPAAAPNGTLYNNNSSAPSPPASSLPSPSSPPLWRIGVVGSTANKRKDPDLALVGQFIRSLFRPSLNNLILLTAFVFSCTGICLARLSYTASIADQVALGRQTWAASLQGTTNRIPPGELRAQREVLEQLVRL